MRVLYFDFKSRKKSILSFVKILQDDQVWAMSDSQEQFLNLSLILELVSWKLCNRKIYLLTHYHQICLFKNKLQRVWCKTFFWYSSEKVLAFHIGINSWFFTGNLKSSFPTQEDSGLGAIEYERVKERLLDTSTDHRLVTQIISLRAKTIM